MADRCDGDFIHRTQLSQTQYNERHPQGHRNVQPNEPQNVPNVRDGNVQRNVHDHVLTDGHIMDQQGHHTDTHTDSMDNKIDGMIFTTNNAFTNPSDNYSSDLHPVHGIYPSDQLYRPESNEYRTLEPETRLEPLPAVSSVLPVQPTTLLSPPLTPAPPYHTQNTLPLNLLQHAPPHTLDAHHIPVHTLDVQHIPRHPDVKHLFNYRLMPTPPSSAGSTAPSPNNLTQSPVTPQSNVSDSYYSEIPYDQQTPPSRPITEMSDRQYHQQRNLLDRSHASTSTLPCHLHDKSSMENLEKPATISQGEFHMNNKRTTAMTDFELYYSRNAQKVAPPRKLCDKYTLLHVITISLAGIAFLTLGVVAGYFIAEGRCDDDCICNDDIIVHIPPSTHAGVSTNLAATTPETTTTGNLDMDSTPMGMGGNETNSTTTETTPETTAIPYCTQESTGCICGPLGGSNGNNFTDVTDYERNGPITAFTVGHNNYFISNLQFSYNDEPATAHGYTHADLEQRVRLRADESVTEVQLDFTMGQPYLTRLSLRTSMGREFGPYGGDGAQRYTVSGDALLYISGRSGPLIDSLALHYTTCT